MAKKPKDARELTAMQRLFALEYLVDLNATEAYARAGGSAKTAYSAGPRLLQHEGVAAAIAEALGRRAKKLERLGDRVLEELMRCGFVDIGEAYDEKGNLKPIREMEPDVRRAIAGLKVFEEFEGSGEERRKVGEVRELKLNDKLRALELLGKHKKLFTDVLEAKVDGLSEDERAERVAELLDRARARRAGQAAGEGEPQLPG